MAQQNGGGSDNLLSLTITTELQDRLNVHVIQADALLEELLAGQAQLNEHIKRTSQALHLIATLPPLQFPVSQTAAIQRIVAKVKVLRSKLGVVDQRLQAIQAHLAKGALAK